MTIRRTSTSQPTASDLAFGVFNEIGILNQLATTQFERVMPEGMTLAQFVVLNHFVRLGGRKRPSDLARAFQVTKATMTSTLTRLEAKGLVRSEPDPSDGRGRLVTITDAGASMRDDCIERLRPRLDHIIAALGAAPFETLIGPLAALRAKMDAMRDKER